MATVRDSIGTGGPGEKGLKSGALGFVSNVVIGVASTKPGYSLAAVLGFVAVAVGVQAPAIMLGLALMGLQWRANPAFFRRRPEVAAPDALEIETDAVR